MKEYFAKLSLLALMILGGALLTEIAFVDWSLPDRVAAKGFIWALIMILANQVLKNRLTPLRVQRH